MGFLRIVHDRASPEKNGGGGMEGDELSVARGDAIGTAGPHLSKMKVFREI
jgi:hypothetical protein